MADLNQDYPGIQESEDMARITVEDCLNKETNRFALVLLAAKRAKQLLKGATPLISETKNKPIVTSLREIAAGKVRYMNAEDKRIAEENERKAQQAREAAIAAQQTTIIAASEPTEFGSSFATVDGSREETTTITPEEQEVTIESISVEVVGSGPSE